MSIECRVKAYDGNDPFLFVSYAHSDAHLVYPIIERLVMDGYRVWYDDGIHAGEDWTESVANRLDDSSICLAMLSENSVASVNCRNEISYSIGGGKTVIGIKLTDFEMPKGMRLQMGSTLYLERYRYGETEFYERLFLSHGMPACRAENPRITEAQLTQWRTRWSDAAPVISEKERPDLKLQPPMPEEEKPPVTEKKAAGNKGGLLVAVLGVLCVLAVAAIFLINGRNDRGQTLSAEQPASIAEPSAGSSLGTAENGIPDAAAVSLAPEAPVSGAPAETPEEQAAGMEGEWIVVRPETSGKAVQILSYRYKGGPEIEKMEYYSSGGINGSVEIDVYYRQNDQIAILVPGAYFGGPVGDEDIELYKAFAERDFKTMSVPFGTKNVIDLLYGPISAADMTTTDNSDFLLWYGFTTEGEIVSVVVVEVGVPLEG